MFQVFSLEMDPLFEVCQKAKIWSPCMVEPVLNKNITFDCKVTLYRGKLYDDDLEHHMKIINRNPKNNNFAINSMGKLV